MLADILVISGICLGIYSFYRYETKSIEISEYNIESNKIPSKFNNFNIIQISDLHNAEFGKNNYRLIKSIDSLKPDIVVITGDLIDGEREDYNIAIDLLNNLSKKYKVYYIKGNHEEKALIKKYKLKYEDYFKELKKIDIIDLNDKIIKIEKENSYINLYGLDIPLNYYKYLFNNEDQLVLDEKFIQDKLGNLNKDEYNILLAHTPFYFEQYSNWGADLVLSGHVHGGIIRIPLLGGLLSPNRRFFPKFDLGKYENNNSIMIVNKGLGKSKVFFRVNCRPEVVRIKLKCKL